jgi:hypothetical protein
MIDDTVGCRNDVVPADDAAAAVELAVADESDLVGVIFDRDLGAADDGWLELGSCQGRESGEEVFHAVAGCSLVENLAKYRFMGWVGSRWAASASSSYGEFHYDPQGSCSLCI